MGDVGSMMRADKRITWAAILGLGIFLSVVWYRNFEIIQVDKAQDLTFINLFRDPHFYPDTFLFRHIYPILLSSIYYWVIGFLGTLFDPYWVLYGCFIVTNCLCIAGLFYLAQTITQNLTASYLSVLALSLQWQLAHALGGSGPLGLSPGALHIATGILLFSISFFLQRRYQAAFALAGFAFNIHASLAIFVLTMFVVALLIRRKWRELGIGVSLAIIAALPMLINTLTHLLSAGAFLPSEQWYQFVRLRSSHHTMPFLFEFDNYVRFIPYLLFFLLGYRMAQRDIKNSALLERYHHVALLTLGILLLCVIGTIFSEWVPVAPLIQLTLFRSTRFFVIFAVILYMSMAIKSFKMHDIRAFVHIFLMAGIVSASFPAIYMALIGLCLISVHKRNRFLAVIAAAFLTMFSIGAWNYVWHRYGSELVLQQSNLPMFFVTFIMLMGYCVLLSWKQSKRFLKPAFLTSLTSVALLSPVYPLFLGRDHFDAAKELQYWLRGHTPKEQLIILPPDTSVWSGLSERGDTFSFTASAYQIYVPNLEKEIMRRFHDYVADPLSFKDGHALENAMVKSYNDWNEAKFLTVGTKYGSDFAVVRKDKKLQFPLLYENERFRVYKMNCMPIVSMKK